MLPVLPRFPAASSFSRHKPTHIVLWLRAVHVIYTTYKPWPLTPEAAADEEAPFAVTFVLPSSPAAAFCCRAASCQA